MNNKASVSNSRNKHSYSQYNVPEYLEKNYWWAYLSPIGVKFFDHPFIVNRILWGQYQKVAQTVVTELANNANDKACTDEQVISGISCAYGNFIPMMANQLNAKTINLFDVAEIQLAQAKKKIAALPQFKCFNLFLANAENIPLASNSTDSTVLFYLLHELPANVRNNVLNEAIRITKPGGRIIVADYAPLSTKHWFHRFKGFRKIFEKMEPFLANFWRCNLHQTFKQTAQLNGKSIKLNKQTFIWHDFYQVSEYYIE